MNNKAKLIGSLKIWIVIYPSITLFLFLFGQQLAGLALYQRTFILTVTLVPWITFIGLPIVNAIMNTFSSKEVKANQ